LAATRPFADLDTLAAHVRDGDVIALPFPFSADFSAAAMSLTRRLIARGVRGLHLIGVPALGYQADLMIGAGCVASVQSGSVLMYEYGPAPRFVAAQKRGTLHVKDSTCPAIHAALMAGEKGLPFMPVRGLIGSDILRHRSTEDGWRIIDNPFGNDDPIVLVPALRPDVVMFHAPLADREGNVWIGRRSELLTLAKAAHKVLVTVEEVVERDLAADDHYAPALVPGVLVTALACVPDGSWPLHCGPRHPEDVAHLTDYARLAKTDEGFAAYLAQHVLPATTDAR
jgi:glutaconate CoA-transferase subunit A